jgi:hypothetical protein
MTCDLVLVPTEQPNRRPAKCAVYMYYVLDTWHVVCWGHKMLVDAAVGQGKEPTPQPHRQLRLARTYPKHPPPPPPALRPPSARDSPSLVRIGGYNHNQARGGPAVGRVSEPGTNAGSHSDPLSCYTHSAADRPTFLA